jgi:hypothetical protein
MGGRNHAASHLKERVMTQTRKFRLIRVGDAKALTLGDWGVGIELAAMRRDEA